MNEEEAKGGGGGMRKRRRRCSIAQSSTSTCCQSNHEIWTSCSRRRKVLYFIILCAGRSTALMSAMPFLCYVRHWKAAVVKKGSCDGHIRAHRGHTVQTQCGRRVVSPFIRLSNTERKSKEFEGEPDEDYDYSTNEAKDDSGEKDDDDDDADADEYFGRFISEAFKEEEGGTSNTKDSDSFTSSSPSSPSPSSEDDILRETKRMMDQQQQQIDLLMKLVQERQPLPPNHLSSAAHIASTPLQPQAQATTTQQKSINVAPLKAMLFIDGTWLYYSLNTRNPRRDAIIPKYGKGWQNNYKVNWQAMPRIICDQIEKQRSSKTSFAGSDRPLEVARVMVFTSAKKETDPNSLRMRMFREMANANYDVHMMETVGQGEKCVDIQLAVEMLHFATVPNAYDVAILLSGDKDFVPALVRTRQKGKQVCIASMRAGCNRVLYESPHIRDYDVVWLEQCLDQLIEPISAEERTRRDRAGYASAFTMMRVVRDYVDAAPDHEWVSSRDIGRYLKHIEIADSNMLEELKQAHGGLRPFLMERACNLFDVKFPEAGTIRGRGEFSFWVRSKADSDETLIDEFKRTQFFTKEEKEFLERYKKEDFIIKVDDPYQHTTSYDPVGSVDDSVGEVGGDSVDVPALDYSQLTVKEMKEICREKGLPVTGKKDVLIDRLNQAIKMEHGVIKKKQLRDESKRPSKYSYAGKRAEPRSRDTIQTGNIYSATLPQIDASRYRNPRASNNAPVDQAVAAHLEQLIKEYLTASGGEAGSRDIGRYLAANGDSRKGNRSALTELKESYGSLLSFILSREDLFCVLDKKPGFAGGDHGFPIQLIQKQAASN